MAELQEAFTDIRRNQSLRLCTDLSLCRDTPEERKKTYSALTDPILWLFEGVPFQFAQIIKDQPLNLGDNDQHSSAAYTLIDESSGRTLNLLVSQYQNLRRTVALKMDRVDEGSIYITSSPNRVIIQGSYPSYIRRTGFLGPTLQNACEDVVDFLRGADSPFYPAAQRKFDHYYFKSTSKGPTRLFG